MAFTDRFVAVPCIKYLERDSGKMGAFGAPGKEYHELLKYIMIDPSQIASYEATMFSDDGADTVRLDGNDQQVTMFLTKTGAMYFSKLGINEFENLINEHQLKRYQE